MIIAIDFDGCLCHDAWPEIGKPRKRVMRKAIRRQRKGDTLILWTCREGESLKRALEWCVAQGLYFDFANENTPERIAEFGNDCRKIGADLYIDDKARWLLW